MRHKILLYLHKEYDQIPSVAVRLHNILAVTKKVGWRSINEITGGVGTPGEVFQKWRKAVNQELYWMTNEGLLKFQKRYKGNLYKLTEEGLKEAENAVALEALK